MNGTLSAGDEIGKNPLKRAHHAALGQKESASVKKPSVAVNGKSKQPAKYQAYNDQSLQTRLVHAGDPTERVAGAAVMPIFQSTTFEFHEGEEVRYTRCNNNPSQVALGVKIASAEGTEAGLATASGMAAVSAALMAFLSAGDHLLVQRGLYGGTHSLAHKQLPRFGIEVTEFDGTAPDTWTALLKSNTKVIYCETISNPTATMPDLPALVAFAKQHQLVSIIDNTFASPATFRPAQHGFTIVVESATKYLNGHSDTVCGAVASTAENIKKIGFMLLHLGGAIDPHAAFLLSRGMQTLRLRMRQHAANALALADMLEGRTDLVSAVYYPGLRSHPGYAQAQQLFDDGGAGGVFAFELRGGTHVADAFMEALHLGLLAVSLGGTETLVCRPANTTHKDLSLEHRAAARISDGLVRVAVGIEDSADLLADFSQALDAAAAALEAQP